MPHEGHSGGQSGPQRGPGRMGQVSADQVLTRGPSKGGVIRRKGQRLIWRGGVESTPNPSLNVKPHSRDDNGGLTPVSSVPLLLDVARGVVRRGSAKGVTLNLASHS